MKYRLLHVAGCISEASVAAGFEASKCYTVNGENYCFYTSGSVLNWHEAKGFCLRKNATMPIITDEDIDNVFQKFIVNHVYNVIQNGSVWIGAHAHPRYSFAEWHWINGQQSSLL